jgi:hypothetical protein
MDDNGSDSECSSLGLTSLDFTGVDWDDDTGASAGAEFCLTEEELRALEIEKRLLVAAKADDSESMEEAKNACSIPVSVQFQRLQHLAELVTAGKYVNALKSSSAKWLLAHDDDDDDDDDDDKKRSDIKNHYFWDRVQRKLTKIRTASECIEAEIIAIAAFNLFLQLNYTGPSMNDIKSSCVGDDKESLSLEGINPHACFTKYLQSSSDKKIHEENKTITSKRDTKYHNTVLSELAVDGMWPCNVVEAPYLLLLARSIFSHLVPLRTKTISLPRSWMMNNDEYLETIEPPDFLEIASKLIAAPMWSARATVAHGRLLLGDEPSQKLWEEVEAIFTRICLENEKCLVHNQQFKATGKDNEIHT